MTKRERIVEKSESSTGHIKSWYLHLLEHESELPGLFYGRDVLKRIQGFYREINFDSFTQVFSEFHAALSRLESSNQLEDLQTCISRSQAASDSMMEVIHQVELLEANK